MRKYVCERKYVVKDVTPMVLTVARVSYASSVCLLSDI